MQERTSRFLILAGTLTALGLPFAVAFPRSFLEKALAMALLVAAAAGIAWAVAVLRKKQGNK